MMARRDVHTLGAMTNERRWRLAWLGGPVIGIANGVTRSPTTALRVGGFWLGLTVLFEFGFGRAVDGKSWDALLRDYDLSTGHLWTLVLAWLALGPCAVRRLQDHVQVPRPAGAR